MRTFQPRGMLGIAPFLVAATAAGWMYEPAQQALPPVAGRISITGPLADGGWWGTGYCGIRSRLADIEAEGTRLVVCVFDTPGGTITGIAETVAAFEAARSRGVRIIAYVTGQCCSAGYWLASACDEIILGSNAEVGCVGALVSFMDFDGIYKAAGATYYRWTSDKTPDKAPEPGTDELSTQIQESVNACGDSFLADLGRMHGLGTDLDAIAEIYQRGKFLPAGQALAAGWADSIVTPGDASMNWLTLGGKEYPPPAKYLISPARAAAQGSIARRSPMGVKSTLVAFIAAGFTGAEAVEERGIFVPVSEADRMLSSLTTAQAQAEASAARVTAAESALRAAADERDTLKDAVTLANRNAALDKHQGKLFAPGQRETVAAKMAKFGIDETIELLALSGGNAGAPLAAKGSGESAPDVGSDSASAQLAQAQAALDKKLGKAA